MIASLSFGEEPSIMMDEQFLLFLATMEQVDDSWLHPIDMQEPESESFQDVKIDISKEEVSEGQEESK